MVVGQEGTESEVIEQVETEAPESAATEIAEAELPESRHHEEVDVTPKGANSIADKAAARLKELEDEGTTPESEEEEAAEQEAVAEEAAGTPERGPDGKFKPKAKSEESSQKPAAAASAYKPNLKFKALDQEHEMDPELASIIKDEATEKKFRSLYERAKGMEFFQEQRNATREQFSQYREQVEPVLQDLQKVATFLQNGDMDSFLAAYGIDEETLLQHAIRVAELRKLPPEQRAAYEAQKRERERGYALAEENQRLRSSVDQNMVQGLSFQINAVLSRPEIQSAIQQFDARVGQPGAFTKELARRGDYYYSKEKKIVPPEQVVNEILQVAGLMPQPATAQPGAGNPNPVVAGGTAPAPTKTDPKTTVVTKPVKKAIPNVTGAGSSTSVVKKRPMSTDDLRKMAAQMED